ncbi:hypothetical protein [Arthrobacter sp. SLBN-122]|uniref:hypothetical protein n=1 Tax=Arthrobacter sp. SLBN-122 TaxID=2768455 RepID=UPI00115179D2|nr:hypothetical protein [Arthrobacter sp. SLBN-122]TQJ35771.1 hypothetical protein FBY36_3050 [Arthrobacter sp. SLBN-122]
MKQIKHLLTHWGIHVAFGISLIVVGWVYWLSLVPKPVPEPGTMEVTELTLWYDLCLAIIGAYFFNLLVVVLPAKRKEASRILFLKNHLSAIAHNGLDLIRELEQIAHCPAYRPTVEHLEKVCMALNNNAYVRNLIATRLANAKTAYRELIPFAADLPLPLQEKLQAESQNWIYTQFDDTDIMPITKDFRGGSIQDLRSIERITFLVPGKGPEYRRDTLAIQASTIMDYYKATEAIKVLLDKYLPKNHERLDDEAVKPGRIMHLFLLNVNDPTWPYVTYPPEASTAFIDEPVPVADFPFVRKS